MDNLGIGKLITTPQQRDAIHVAVLPAIAAQQLSPGSHVGLRESDQRAYYWDPYSDKTIGIVDPFLTHPVHEGETFWLFLYPNTITALRHHWTHPSLTEQEGVVGKKEAELEKEITRLRSELEDAKEEVAGWDGCTPGCYN